MKKTTTVATLIFLALTTFSFTGLEKTQKEIKINSSTVNWKGYKVTGSHKGTIGIQSGNLIFEESFLVGGTFIIDMTTITVTDLEGEYKSKLENHLKSDDFRK